jgi:N-acetylglucosamine-6-phosphate deacetylase
VSLEKRGGIHPQHVQKPDVDVLKRILDLCEGTLKLMTVAPELEGIDRIIDLLFENGVVPCLGHSNGTVRRGLDAAQRGTMGMTHLFNAMSPISHKDPGIALVPFLDRDIHFELNGDGIHVAPEILKLCYQALNRERMILISDAVVSAGKAHGRYPFFGRTVVSDANGVRCAETGTLVGSNLLILDVIRNFIGVTGSALAEAMRMATLNPCRLLGLDGQRGSIAVGKRADLVLLGKDLRIVRVLID